MRNDKVKSLIANTIDLYSDTNINQEDLALIKEMHLLNL